MVRIPPTTDTTQKQLKSFSMTNHHRFLEKSIATASFMVAVALSFTSLLIGETDDIASNVLFVIAQFLTLTATILGIDYKFNGNNNAQGNTPE